MINLSSRLHLSPGTIDLMMLRRLNACSAMAETSGNFTAIVVPCGSSDEDKTDQLSLSLVPWALQRRQNAASSRSQRSLRTD